MTFQNRELEKTMIAKGSPWKLKIKPKAGVLHFDTDGNLLFVGEEDERGARWTVLGHVLPLDVPHMNQPLPKVVGVPYATVRLMGVGSSREREQVWRAFIHRVSCANASAQNSARGW
jgi:hypothetical protein